MWQYFGVLCNTLTVLAGGMLGIFIRRKKGAIEQGEESLPAALMVCLGFCTVFAAWSGMSAPENGAQALICVISLVLGLMTGYLLRLDQKINALGSRVSGGANAGRGFVTACLLFCTGSMTLLGSFESAKNGGPVLDLNCHTTLLIKSLLDLVSSSCLATVYGASVLASAGFVLFFQGALVAAASLAQPFLDQIHAMPVLSCVGSLILMAIAVNLLGLRQIKTGDYLPALLYPVIICWGLYALGIAI